MYTQVTDTVCSTHTSHRRNVLNTQVTDTVCAQHTQGSFSKHAMVLRHTLSTRQCAQRQHIVTDTITQHIQASPTHTCAHTHTTHTQCAQHTSHRHNVLNTQVTDTMCSTHKHSMFKYTRSFSKMHGYCR